MSDNQETAAPRYSVAELTQHSQILFGCQPEVVTGAIYGAHQSLYTVAELQELINKFLSRKVNG
jgi:hypothetical protein